MKNRKTMKVRVMEWYTKHGSGTAKACAHGIGAPNNNAAICAILIQLRKSGTLYRTGERGHYVYALSRIKTYVNGNADGSKGDVNGGLPGGEFRLGLTTDPILDPMLDFSTGAIQRVLEARVSFLERQTEKVKAALEALQ